MKIHNLFEYTALNIKLDEIIYEFNNWCFNEVSSLCNTLLIKYITYTNLESEIKEILKYKRLSDSIIYFDKL